MTLRINIDPYFKKIADYYWDERPVECQHVTIWQWLERDYGALKIGARGSKGESIVSFPDEAHKTMFLLRWG